MKRLLFVLPVLVLLHGCSILFAKEQPWSFVAAVGGLKIETPFQSERKWVLPIQADVSGLKAITTKPTTMNSGLVCEAVRAQVKGHDIFLVIKTTVVHGNAKSVCPAAKLGTLAKGRYNVWYGTPRLERISLGTVDVAL